MSGTFSNRKKLIMLAAAVAEKMPYVKNATSLFSQGELKGKKYGQKVTGYIPDAGTVSNGLVANPDKVTEVEVNAWIRNKNTAVEVDLWDQFVNIEDFKKEIIDKKAGKLAREVQKDIVGENVYRSLQAVVATSIGFGMLTESAAALDELAVDGDIVTFLSPTIHSKIAESGLSKFLQSEKMKEIYEENYLGQYAGSAQVQLAGMPVLDTTGASTAPTISAEVVKDASNNVIGLKPIATITHGGSGALKVGVPYKVTGLKVVDESGIETDQDFVVIVNSEVQYGSDGSETTVVYVPEIRLTVDGKGFGNPNAHMDATTLAAAISDSTATFTLEPLVTIGKKYAIGQARTVKGLSFDQYRFDDLPAAKQENVGTFEGITLKMQSASHILNGTEVTRIDMPWCAKIFRPEESCTIYLQLN